MNNYVQYGCGLSSPDSWRNFDASPTLRMQRLPVVGLAFLKAGIGPNWAKNVEYGDVIKGLPVSPSSCKAIYCSHVLEHLALEDFRKALKNTYTALETDGIFRFVLPDLEFMTEQYVANDAPNAAVDFIHGTGMGLHQRKKGIRGIAWALWGNSGHRWLWDFKSMKAELESAGFKHVRRAHFGDSAEPMFKDVEDPNRWENALGVECRK